MEKNKKSKIALLILIKGNVRPKKQRVQRLTLRLESAMMNVVDAFAYDAQIFPTEKVPNGKNMGESYRWFSEDLLTKQLTSL